MISKQIKQIKRITRYETLMNKAEQLIKKYSKDDADELCEIIKELESYYLSDEWKQDFSDDEAGLLPPDLKRGVLSEDGIYSLLESYKELKVNRLEEYFFNRFRVISKVPEKVEAFSFSDEDAHRAEQFHRSLPLYSRTPLSNLKCTAEYYKVGSILVKDESTRFGLKAFKGLGGSYCMFRILCEKLGIDYTSADYSTFLDEWVRKKCADITFVTATDGNHGKGVSWAAKLFGCSSYVFMPAGTVEARKKAIEDAGNAIVRITDVNYDHTVRYAAELAKENDWILIQDTAWTGYEKYPKLIIEGYLTLAAEAVEQMEEKIPTHIFLQAGVGSMAGGIEDYFIGRAGKNPPLVTIVEPKEAACIYDSIHIDDGEAHSIDGNPVTIMAGLNCGTPCKTVWPILRDESSYFCACEDELTIKGMRGYIHPIGSDPSIISGESGAVTYGLLLTILESTELRELFRISNDSVIFLINTEGDTDPEGYERIIKRT